MKQFIKNIYVKLFCEEVGVNMYINRKGNIQKIDNSKPSEYSVDINIPPVKMFPQEFTKS